MSRIASSILVSAIVKSTELLGGNCTIERKGASVSGAIFISMYHRPEDRYSWYEPALQGSFSDSLDIRRRFFSLKSKGLTRMEVVELIDREAEFDSDFWLVEIDGVSIEDLAEVIPLA